MVQVLGSSSHAFSNPAVIIEMRDDRRVREWEGKADTSVARACRARGCHLQSKLLFVSLPGQGSAALSSCLVPALQVSKTRSSTLESNLQKCSLIKQGGRQN